MAFIIHRFEIARIFGQPEAYEEHTNLSSCMRRLKWLANRDDDFSYWAESTDSNEIFNADEDCGYCGTSQDPNDICIACFDKLPIPHFDD